MEIEKAGIGDLQTLRDYDCHIPLPRLEHCIREGRIFVLRGGQTLLGMLRYSLFWQTVPFLDLLILREAYRGQGYGRRMMACWEEEMARAGYGYTMLSTQADETAKYFYEKLGYRRIGAFQPPEQDAEEIMYLKELRIGCSLTVSDQSQ